MGAEMNASLSGKLRPKDLNQPMYEADVSKSTGEVYFRNKATGQTQWEVPSNAIVDPLSPEKLSRVAGAVPDAARGQVDGRRSSRPPSEAGSVGSYAGSSSLGSYWSVTSGEKMNCICEICECGKHHCRLKPKVSSFGPQESAYRHDYPWHDPSLTVSKPAPPKYQPQDFDQGHFDTTQRSAFIKHDLPTRSAKPVVVASPMGKFEAQTTYQMEHTPKEFIDTKRGIVQHKLPPKIPFDHQTMHRTNYIERPFERREPIKPSPTVIPNTPFDGDTTYGNSFKEYESGPTERHLPKIATPSMPEDRDFLSTKQSAYVKPPLRICPAANLPKKMSSRHTGHTHYHKRLQNCDGECRATYTVA